MSKFVTRQAKCLVGAYDYSANCNKMGIDFSGELKDVTNLSSTGKEKLVGYTDWKASYGGFMNPGLTNYSAELSNFQYMGVTDIPILMCPTNGAEGDICYFGKSISVSYTAFGQVGEAAPFDISAEGNGKLVRGNVLKIGTVTTSGNSTAQNLGAVLATQYLYGQVHCFAATGTNITIKIQSDDNSGFSSPIDRITFTALTTPGFQFAAPVTGAITDNYWRAIWTVTGTTPSFDIAVAMGIA